MLTSSISKLAKGTIRPWHKTARSPGHSPQGQSPATFALVFRTSDTFSFLGKSKPTTPKRKTCANSAPPQTRPQIILGTCVPLQGLPRLGIRAPNGSADIHLYQTAENKEGGKQHLLEPGDQPEYEDVPGSHEECIKDNLPPNNMLNAEAQREKDGNGITDHNAEHDWNNLSDHDIDVSNPSHRYICICTYICVCACVFGK